MMIRLPLLFAFSIVKLPSTHAWGTLGHDTVAYIAQSFVSTKRQLYCQGILNDSSASYLANVATWADSYRYTAEGSFSAPFHYIDAQDSPPESCNVDFERDCGDEGCVVSAIANYTSRLRSTASRIGAAEKQKALKLMVHFVGDIHQPLHDEAVDIGGNTINVTYDGVLTNLHHIWDSNIAEAYRGGQNLTFAMMWAASLTDKIQKGQFKTQAAQWLAGINIDDATGTAMDWATDANAYVCSTVMPEGVDAIEGNSITTGDEYYDVAVPVIELLIAKAGYRLAAWLNLIATGETGLKVGHYNREFKRSRPRIGLPGVGLERRSMQAPTAAQLAEALGRPRC